MSIAFLEFSSLVGTRVKNYYNCNEFLHFYGISLYIILRGKNGAVQKL